MVPSAPAKIAEQRVQDEKRRADEQKKHSHDPQWEDRTGGTRHSDRPYDSRILRQTR